MIRKLDELGRIILPIEVRRALNKIGDTGKYICCGCSEIIKNI